MNYWGKNWKEYIVSTCLELHSLAQYIYKGTSVCASKQNAISVNPETEQVSKH